MKPEEVLVESTGVIGQRIKKVNAETLCTGFYVLSACVLCDISFCSMDFAFEKFWINYLRSIPTSLNCIVSHFSFHFQGPLLNSLPTLVNSLSSSVEG